MSLKSQPEFLAAGVFETETAIETSIAPETAIETKDKTMTTNTQQVDAGVAATTAIARAATTTAIARAATTPNALSSYKAPPKLVPAFADKNGVFDVGTVEELALAIPRIKGEQGALFAGDVDLGAEIQFEVVSVSPRWVIGTGDDDAEALEHFRVSYDNATISGHGMSVDDYINDLKAQGFEKANKSPYLDIFGFITWSEAKGHVPDESRELSCMQCSKTSLGAYKAFATTRGLLISKGVAKEIDVIEVHAEKRVKGSMKYTNFSFHAPKAK